MINNEFVQYRKMTNDEFGCFVRNNRAERGMTQEELAELSGLESKTILRVENGQTGNPGSRCAITKALGFDDADCFNKPVPIPDFEKIKKHQEKLENETIKIELKKIMSARELREFSESNGASQFSICCKEVAKDASSTFATVEDYLRDYMMIYSDLTACDKMTVDDELENYIQSLSSMGYSIGVGKAFFTLKNTIGDEPVKLAIMHCMLFLENDFQNAVRIPRDAKISF